LDPPPQAEAGSEIPIRVVLTSNKVGHDYPTGPLDIIQSWVELRVTDSDGAVVFTSGTRDERHFIEPGSFLFKVEPVDEYGALIDRHNLWEMVGVRFKRSLFPGFADAAEYSMLCPTTTLSERQQLPPEESFAVEVPQQTGALHVEAKLQYRKIDQFLLNFLMGEDSGLTAPITTISEARGTIPIASTAAHPSPTPEIGG